MKGKKVYILIHENYFHKTLRKTNHKNCVPQKFGTMQYKCGDILHPLGCATTTSLLSAVMHAALSE